MAKEQRTFQAEVSKLLDIVAHSLYSNREIFLRELVSNASDACDKLRYAALTDDSLLDGEADFQIRLSVDAEAKTLTVSDNGIGMSHDELVENLGTIARSGTQAFVEGLSGDEKKDSNLIGQFGVGFYSSFMVSDSVTVVSRKAGEDAAWSWTSDGRGEFTMDEAQKDGRGTTITLTLKEDAVEYLEEMRLRTVIKTYSDHIAVPVILEGTQGAEGEEAEDQTLNTASALWTRSKSEITEEQYKEFYHHAAHAFDEPWLTLHNKAEGVVEYTNLLFVPASKPFDLFDQERKSRVKLYVKRVFITDDCEDLLPPYLRFLRGVVDSQDLPLNVSREMLQDNPVLAKIRTGLVKKILAELSKKAEKAPEEYATFWDNFGAVLKEGIYEDFANKDKVVELARFHTTKGDDMRSLADYVADMKEGQEAIYYITGEDLDSVSQSPQLEGFKAKGIEVLLLTDPIDEFWLPAAGTYQEKEFKSATKSGVDLDQVDGETKDGEDKAEDKPDTPALDKLIAQFKVALGETVKDVRPSHRLTDSAVCLVADADDMDMNMSRLLRRHQRLDQETPRILELNPGHSLVKKLTALAEADQSKALIDDAAFLLLDQARIVEGDPIPDPAAFSRRMALVMEKGLG
ncbi:molecular chaperone HtpG [Magnetospira sp. QH-2]|uniref:molecular chaperone HtpG n=1 Tax=Magnetospira sp. (strain QH-2) TaxID=1288970 RepID=UPI0003E811FE|nr:molecular chaperone HtpG [Magnetospira sp. QH-2]CCQ75533.1 molecular chaperone HSP90 family [Magnetospira sp. QH-2]